MKYRLIFIFILFIPILIFGQNQIFYLFETSDLEGYNQQLKYYVEKSLDNFSFANISSLKFSEEFFFLGKHYLRNYFRECLFIRYSNNNHTMKYFFNFEWYPDKNIPNTISGLSGSYLLAHGLSSGIYYKYVMNDFFSDFKFNYSYQSFEEARTSDDETQHISEADVFSSIKLGMKSSGYFNPYILLSHFDDLNESTIQNYNIIEAGTDYTNKLTRIHFLKQDFSFGYNDTNSDIPYFFKSETRFTSKLVHSWQFINRLEIKLWSDKELNEFYDGNNLFETLIQKNFKFSPMNFLTRLQVGSKSYLSERKGLVKSNFQYYILNFILWGQYKYYYGDNWTVDQKIEGKISTVFYKKMIRISYKINKIENKIIADELIHGISFDLNF
ncbi:MAG: hypothetical protein K8S23_00205 [Candidatus Cloacimonetes bacterium]|nr:hypothetical protein [Candidatus Cloacimonadota bacterium]